MSIYIRATACISPQYTFDGPPPASTDRSTFPATPEPSLPTADASPLLADGSIPLLYPAVEYFGNRLTCIEPDYKGLIDPKLIRRMSRVIKMGVAAATKCLREGGGLSPDAIVTGSAYGCLEDTGIFLTRIIEQQEEMLSPTAFIQSTHNTVGGQIALLLKCHGYNNTFVHRGHSFESALLDSMLLIEENPKTTVLTGGIDETTDTSHAILSRFGLYRQPHRSPETSSPETSSPTNGSPTNSSPKSNSPATGSNLGLLYPEQESKGTMAGEGAAFFLLTGMPSKDDYARLDAMTTFYKPDGVAEIENRIASFLASHSIRVDEIDLVITGQNGDKKEDAIYAQLQKTIFKDKKTIRYKHLCGEYPTSTSFALWLGANILKTGVIQDVVDTGVTQWERSGNIKRILIYNQYQQSYHSLMLISSR